MRRIYLLERDLCADKGYRPVLSSFADRIGKFYGVYFLLAVFSLTFFDSCVYLSHLFFIFGIHNFSPV